MKGKETSSHDHVATRDGKTIASKKHSEEAERDVSSDYAKRGPSPDRTIGEGVNKSRGKGGKGKGGEGGLSGGPSDQPPPTSSMGTPDKQDDNKAPPPTFGIADNSRDDSPDSTSDKSQDLGPSSDGGKEDD